MGEFWRKFLNVIANNTGYIFFQLYKTYIVSKHCGGYIKYRQYSVIIRHDCSLFSNQELSFLAAYTLNFFAVFDAYSDTVVIFLTKPSLNFKLSFNIWCI